MPRHLYALLLWLALGMPGAHAATLAITYAEQPVQLVRETGMFSAGRGVTLRRDDLLASNESTILLDTGNATIAIGPASRVYVNGAHELVLLEGWLKVQGRAEPAVRVRAPGLQLTGATATATAMVRVTPKASEVFAEAGELALDELDGGKAARRLRLPSEQFAVRTGVQAVRILPRPQLAYLAAMPAGLRDLLVAVPRGAAVAPKRTRAATFAEVAPWLATHPDLRQRVQRRFYPPQSARSSN